MFARGDFGKNAIAENTIRILFFVFEMGAKVQCVIPVSRVKKQLSSPVFVLKNLAEGKTRGLAGIRNKNLVHSLLGSVSETSQCVAWGKNKNLRYGACKPQISKASGNSLAKHIGLFATKIRLKNLRALSH